MARCGGNKHASLTTDASRRAALLVAYLRPARALLTPGLAAASAPTLAILFPPERLALRDDTGLSTGEVGQPSEEQEEHAGGRTGERSTVELTNTKQRPLKGLDDDRKGIEEHPTAILRWHLG